MRFLCDSMLGRLARYLRMLGADTAGTRCRSADAVLKQAIDEKRILVTRRTAFLHRPPAVPVCFIACNEPVEQLRYMSERYTDDFQVLRPFSRCLNCNSELASIDRSAAEGHVPEYVFNTVSEFRQCFLCRRIYWPGTHHAHMRMMVAPLAARRYRGLHPE